MADSEETKRLRAETQQLQLALIQDLDYVAGAMNVAFLLSDADLREVQNVKTLLTAEDKATKLVTSLKDKVKCKSANYNKFLKILREREDDFEDIISRLAGRPMTTSIVVCQLAIPKLPLEEPICRLGERVAPSLKINEALITRLSKMFPQNAVAISLSYPPQNPYNAFTL